ncbi:hypothetical protein [Polyangium jinanense]|uniref:Uncharacterized protein n=1 Tax=Polyangium jinanense TaxID=2829994 RepID=A0A9X4AVM9_9BACT|nr:hypothetical protein [Polyangium jinanense]MDC3960786.1 hypothetical protein [Polyangium jinanense]MDC3985836.1 hypothetical protein [Polyangium jinanense]
MHDAEELRRFARKDWAAAARGKEHSFRDWKRKHGPAAGIRIAGKFSTKKTHPSKPPKGKELVALVHDPLHTRPYRQAWQSILAAPVLHGSLLTNPDAR